MAADTDVEMALERRELQSRSQQPEAGCRNADASQAAQEQIRQQAMGLELDRSSLAEKEEVDVADFAVELAMLEECEQEEKEESGDMHSGVGGPSRVDRKGGRKKGRKEERKVGE